LIAILKAANLAVRFGLELALLVSLAVFCWRTLPAGAVRFAGTVGVPIVVMLVWAVVVHGAAVPAAVQLGTQVMLFGLAVGTLAALRRPDLAVGFGGACAANAALMSLWHQ
jgi:hypothetical protein